MNPRTWLNPDKVLESGLQAVQQVKKVADSVSGAFTPKPLRPGTGNTRFVPPPPPAPTGEAESLENWGFADTRFEVRDDGHVWLTGGRYSLCGEPIPGLLPWVRSVMHPDITATNVHPYQFAPVVPAPTRNDAFLQTISGFLAADQWSEDDHIRLRHGHGHTQEEMYKIKYEAGLPRVPDLVVWPQSEAEIVQLVQAAQRHGAALIPFGGGTNVTDALRCNPSESRCIVSVDMRRMNKILWIDPVNRMAQIEAGAVGRHIMAQLAQYGFTMGHEPDSVEFSTLGGWVATHASGMKKNKYGNIEDIIIDCRVMTAQGLIERTAVGPRESVGLDPRLWLLGSEGKLGIVTTVTIKLFPLPEVQKYGSVLFKDFETGVAFMYDLAQAGNWPSSVRLMDNMQFQFGQALKHATKGWKVHKSKLEKAFVTQIQGFDPTQMTALTLVFEGTPTEVEAQEKQVYEIAKKHGGMAAGAENGSRGYQLTYGIAYIRDFVMRHWVLAESFETSVPWSLLPAMVEAVKARLYRECEERGIPGKPFVTARVTQIYETGAAVYFYFAFYYKGVDNPTQVYHQIENAAREEMLRHGASLSHHHGIGKLRQHFLPQILSAPGLQFAAAAKQALDPTNVFASGNQTPVA